MNFLFILTSLTLANAYVTSNKPAAGWGLNTAATNLAWLSEGEPPQLDLPLASLGRELRSLAFDPNSPDYGIASSAPSDSAFEIETVEGLVPVKSVADLALSDLKTPEPEEDPFRSGNELVMVSSAPAHEWVRPGDLVVAVSSARGCGATRFLECTSGRDRSHTLNALQRGVQHAVENGCDALRLEVNRLVPKV